MELVFYPDPRLLVKCDTAHEGQKYRLDLAINMWKIMTDNNGVGLAAPQIGLNMRMFVWKEKGRRQAIWNPVLRSIKGCQKSLEGCLSLPGIKVTLQRAISCILHGTGINNQPVGFTGDVNTTTIWQHEIDHLDGKLIIDNMSHKESMTNKNALQALLKNVSLKE